MCWFCEFWQNYRCKMIEMMPYDVIWCHISSEDLAGDVFSKNLQKKCWDSTGDWLRCIATSSWHNVFFGDDLVMTYDFSKNNYQLNLHWWFLRWYWNDAIIYIYNFDKIHKNGTSPTESTLTDPQRAKHNSNATRKWEWKRWFHSRFAKKCWGR